MFRVFSYENVFEKRLKKVFSKFEQKQVFKIIEELKVNLYVGDIISFYFFREKKIEGKRIYYLIYSDYNVVFLVRASNKKLQQIEINNIKNLLPYFKKYVLEKISIL